MTPVPVQQRRRKGNKKNGRESLKVSSLHDASRASIRCANLSRSSEVKWMFSQRCTEKLLLRFFLSLSVALTPGAKSKGAKGGTTLLPFQLPPSIPPASGCPRPETHIPCPLHSLLHLPRTIRFSNTPNGWLNCSDSRTIPTSSSSIPTSRSKARTWTVRLLRTTWKSADLS